MQRDALISYLDTFLGTHSMQDRSNNGLQVEGSDDITRAAFAVDACQAAIDGATAAGAQILIVHHGLFWSEPLPIVGPHRRRVGALLAAKCSLYGVHMPLDRHEQVGNNVELARLTGLTPIGEMGEVAGGQMVGLIAEPPGAFTLDELTARVAAALDVEPFVQAAGPATVARVGIISGSAARWIAEAAAKGCDAFLTGETSHSHYHEAAEYGINVIYAGHYATETVGLRALAAHLEDQFGLETTFIAEPTGM
jgi:dinuclear metal center YbgI/SA1388 family protein